MKTAVLWLLRRVTLVRTEVSEEGSASIIRVTRIDEIGTGLAVINKRRTLRRNISTSKVVPTSPVFLP
jgi:hypothetical protein